MKKILFFALILINSTVFYSQVNSKFSDEERKLIIKKFNNYTSFSKSKNNLIQSKSLKYYLDSLIGIENNPIDNYKLQNTYNNQSNCDSSEYLTWNDSTNQWNHNIGNIKERFYYINENDFGVLISFDNIYSIRFEYIHDLTGNLILCKYFEFIPETNSWFYLIKEENNYNQNLLQNKYIYQKNYLDSNVWNNLSKVENTYANDLLTNVSYFNYDSVILDYKVYFKHIIHYNNLNQIDTITDYKTLNTDSLILSDKFVFNYNGNNLITEKITINNFGMIINRESYFYDSFNNLIKEEYGTENQISIINFHFYDNAVQASDVVFPNSVLFNLDQFYWLDDRVETQELTFLKLLPIINTNKIDSSHFTYPTSNHWNNGYFYYSQHELSLNTILDNPIKIYPNPVTNFINIEESSKFESFELIDTKGKLVLKEKLNTSKIDISTLQNGIYFLNLFTDNKVIVRNKIIKE